MCFEGELVVGHQQAFYISKVVIEQWCSWFLTDPARFVTLIKDISKPLTPQ